ncbi:ABC transporter permease [Candidatus Fermentibacteria bacterium]|nr:ABC transporter permease [Candidatus Fermentibacteria bacterium]
MEAWPPYVFPTPQGVASALAGTASRGMLALAVWGSLRRLWVGYAIALVSGTVIGVLMAHARWFKNTFGLLVLGLQTLPSICWLPLAILWFGLSEKAIVFVVVMGAFLSIALAAEDGIRNTPGVFVQAARNLGAGGPRLYRTVILPSALPSFVTGMKLGWSFAWRSLMAGELIYAVPGLGYLLMMGRELNDMNQVVGVISVIMLTGLLTDKLVFSVMERALRARWGNQPGR